MQIELQPLGPEADEALLAFECAHRTFFEQWVHPRSELFYSKAGVRAHIEAAQEDARADRAYAYLIWSQRRLLGRINLSEVERQRYGQASLGYRLAADAQGQGVASQAVAQLLGLAFGRHGLWRVEAQVRPSNVASIVTDRHIGATP